MTDMRETDLRELQALHALDDSLIDSLLTSKAQASAHIEFWIRTMWMVNGTLIAILSLIVGFSARQLLRGGPLLLWPVLIVAVCGLLLVISVLHRQRRAAKAIKIIATKHDLV